MTNTTHTIWPLKATVAALTLILGIAPVSATAEEPDDSPINIVFNTNVRVEGNTEVFTNGVQVSCSVGANWQSVDGTPVTWRADPVIIQESGPIAAPINVPVELRINGVSRRVFTFYDDSSAYEWHCQVTDLDGAAFGTGSPFRTAVAPATAGTCDAGWGWIGAISLNTGGDVRCAQ